MDRHQFDRLTRTLAIGLGRRRFGLGTTGALLAGVLLPRSALACKKLKKSCGKNSDCCSGAVCKHDKCRCKNGWQECDGDGRCENLANDDLHCGACGVACGSFEHCCHGTCVSIRDNDAHCGSCDVACATNETCCTFSCTDLQTSELHCGDCDTACGSHSDTCIDGVCAPFICPADAEGCEGPSRECNGQIGCRCVTRASNGAVACGQLQCGHGCGGNADCAGLGAGAFCASGGDFCCTNMNGQDVCVVPCVMQAT